MAKKLQKDAKKDQKDSILDFEIYDNLNEKGPSDTLFLGDSDLTQKIPSERLAANFDGTEHLKLEDFDFGKLSMIVAS